MLSLNARYKFLLDELVRSERCGRYDVAIQLLGDIWEDKGELPKLTDLNNVEAAELLLRCGGLVGFLGLNKQFPSFQENSRNLLTEARERFLDIYDDEKIAECENYLAMTEKEFQDENIELVLSHELSLFEETEGV